MNTVAFCLLSKVDGNSSPSVEYVFFLQGKILFTSLHHSVCDKTSPSAAGPNLPNLGTHKQRLFVYYITRFLIVSSKITVSLKCFLIYIVWASVKLKGGAVVFDLEKPKICLVARFASLILRQDFRGYVKSLQNTDDISPIITIRVDAIGYLLRIKCSKTSQNKNSLFLFCTKLLIRNLLPFRSR